VLTLVERGGSRSFHIDDTSIADIAPKLGVDETGKKFEADFLKIAKAGQ
jgi:hypothetical protein